MIDSFITTVLGLLDSTAITVLSLIFKLGLAGPALLFLFGAFTGCWFYRLMLKRDPAKLERWVTEAKALGDIARKL